MIFLFYVFFYYFINTKLKTRLQQIRQIKIHEKLWFLIINQQYFKHLIIIKLLVKALSSRYGCFLPSNFFTPDNRRKIDDKYRHMTQKRYQKQQIYTLQQFRFDQDLIMVFVLQDIETYTAVRLAEVALEPELTHYQYVDRINVATMNRQSINKLKANISTLNKADQASFKYKIIEMTKVRGEYLTQQQETYKRNSPILYFLQQHWPFQRNREIQSFQEESYTANRLAEIALQPLFIQYHYIDSIQVMRMNRQSIDKLSANIATLSQAPFKQRMRAITNVRSRHLTQKQKTIKKKSPFFDYLQENWPFSKCSVSKHIQDGCSKPSNDQKNIVPQQSLDDEQLPLFQFDQSESNQKIQ